MDFARWQSLQAGQLAASGVPEELHHMLFTKLANLVLDAGNAFAFDERSGALAATRVVTRPAMARRFVPAG